ncbi:MAG: hypothetical protein IJH95_00425 [Mogibacterium sp.]|nr:hypothetical protein [Mogibacterium sp.]
MERRWERDYVQFIEKLKEAEKAGIEIGLEQGVKQGLEQGVDKRHGIQRLSYRPRASLWIRSPDIQAYLLMLLKLWPQNQLKMI